MGDESDKAEKDFRAAIDNCRGFCSAIIREDGNMVFGIGGVSPTLVGAVVMLQQGMVAQLNVKIIKGEGSDVH